MRAKVYTVTPCIWQSYGSILQAMSLQSKLCSMGYDSSIIKCEPYPADMLKRMPIEFKSFKRFLSSIYKRHIFQALNRRYQSTNSFLRKYVDITYYDTYEQLVQNPPKADAFIAGSDQIWNPDNMCPFFYLDFAKSECKRISYAASMGITNIPAHKATQMAEYLKNFQALSVREADNVPVLRQYTQKKISVNVDPVFLQKSEQWRKYETEYPMSSRPYILVYAIYWEKSLNAQLKELHKKTGMEIVAISSGLQCVYATKRIFDADPGQFLWLLDHAAAVVTSSFHGVAMSILFQKPLAAVIDPNASSRIACLRDTLEIAILPIPDLLENGKKIDYPRVNEHIAKEQTRSESYLREALSEI